MSAAGLLRAFAFFEIPRFRRREVVPDWQPYDLGKSETVIDENGETVTGCPCMYRMLAGRPTYRRMTYSELRIFCL